MDTIECLHAALVVAREHNQLATQLAKALEEALALVPEEAKTTTMKTVGGRLPHLLEYLERSSKLIQDVAAETAKNAT